MGTVAVNAVDGLAFGMLLFTVAVGLNLVFGVMGVLNLSHGTLYLAGACLAAQLAGPSLFSWLIAVLAGLAGGAVLGIGLDVLLRPLTGGGPFEQVLLTLGMALIGGWAYTSGIGGASQSVTPPAVLSASITLFGHGYPVYRLLFIVLAALLAVGLQGLLRHSHTGRVLRATIDDPGMAAATGIRTGLVRAVALAVGCALAALGGVLGAPLIGPGPGVDTQILTLSLIIVVVGGASSVQHTLTAGLLVGEVQAFTADAPAAAPFLLFAVLLAALVLRGRTPTAARIA